MKRPFLWYQTADRADLADQVGHVVHALDGDDAIRVVIEVKVREAEPFESDGARIEYQEAARDSFGSDWGINQLSITEVGLTMVDRLNRATVKRTIQDACVAAANGIRDRKPSMAPPRPAFCFVCGKPLAMGYPGGDPENGAARSQCPEGHPTVTEHVYERHAVDFAMAVLEDCVSMVGSGANHETEEAEKIQLPEDRDRDVAESAARVLRYLMGK